MCDAACEYVGGCWELRLRRRRRRTAIRIATRTQKTAPIPIPALVAVDMPEFEAEAIGEVVESVEDEPPVLDGPLLGLALVLEPGMLLKATVLCTLPVSEGLLPLSVVL